MKKRIFALFMSVVMVFTLTVSAYAESIVLEGVTQAPPPSAAVEKMEEQIEKAPEQLLPAQPTEPTEGDETPGEGEQTTGEGEQTPGEGEQTSGEGEQTPGEGEQTPGEGEQTPGEGEQTPGEGEQTPGEGEPVCPGDDTCTIEGCQNHNPPAPVVSCSICGAEGHVEEDCTVECSICGEKHLDEDCTVKCEQCGDKHLTENCTAIACDYCGKYTHPAVECPECKACLGIEGAEHSETCELRCEHCGVVILDETTPHAETCITLAVCEICGEKQDHFTEDCAFYGPVTAEVYTEADGVYTLIDGHGESTPIDVEDYDGKTIYVLESDTAQNVYFEHGTFLGIGVTYSIDDETCARLNDADDNTWLGSGKALVTVAAGVPAETEITLTADMGMLGKQSVTIKVIEELPEEELPEIENEVDGKIFTVSGVNIPGNGEIKVEEPDAEILSEVKSEMEAYFAEMRTDRTPNEITPLFAYDISVLDAEQKEWQPDGTVKITLGIPELFIGAYEKVYIGHMHDGEVQLLEAAENFEDNTITFTTDGFSVFYGFIVDFEYNGYKFSIDGGSEVMLSEIMEELEIDQDIEDVSEVSFSDSELFSIEEEDSDWKLTSLRSFGTDEWLIVSFNNGTSIEIKVTDPVLFYYLDGTNWGMTTFENEIGGSTYISNEDSISGESLGVVDGEDTSRPSDAIIYARPGMAIRFDRYSHFSSVKEIDHENGNISEDGLWRWISAKDSSPSNEPSHNFVIIDSDITSVETTTFTVPIADHGNEDYDEPERDKDGKPVVDSEGNTVYVYACEIKIVIVPDSEAPTLLKTALTEEGTPDNIKNTYSIREIPVTLYNYDGAKYKEKYSKGGNFFSFKGVSKGDDVTFDNGNLTEKGHSNGGGPVMGILKNTLQGDEKLPVMAEGQNIDLFSSTEFDGKEVRNVMFEFVYDSEGYYTFSSDINHAQLSDDGTKVELYREALGTTADFALNGSSPNYAAGGFYPYADINKAIKSNASVMSWEDWKGRLSSGYVGGEAAPYGMDLVDSATKVQPFSTVDMHNGLQLAANFYLSADKKTPTGEHIVYQFTGDDDLWVFIDDKLVLDIGGGHGPVSGSINFTTGAVTVEGPYYKFGNPEEAVPKDYTGSFTIEGDQIHSLKIFYLERYGGVSNCRMRFNLPLVPSNAVNISKTLTNQDNLALSVAPDVSYGFKLYAAEGENDATDADRQFSVKANAPYTVVGNGAPTGTQYTGNDGTFQLKSGWTASFEGIERFTAVYVVESLLDDGFQYAGHTVSVNGNTSDYIPDTKTETKVMQADSSITFDFVNKMWTQPLTIEKQVVNGTDGLIDPEQKFNFDIVFTKDCVAASSVATTGSVSSIDVSDKETENDDKIHLGGTFQLGHNDSVTIPRVPVNMTYTLQEIGLDTDVSDGTYFDAPTYTLKVGDTEGTFVADGNTVQANGENKVTVTNLQRFAVTIQKSISDGSDPDQSFIFKLKGTDGHTENIERTVVISLEDFKNGSASKVITGLPVGGYTVTEDGNWSWRYEITQQTGTVDKNDQTAEFANSRENIYWLDGSSHCQNVFTDKEISRNPIFAKKDDEDENA